MQSSSAGVISALIAGALYALAAVYLAYRRRLQTPIARLGVIYLALCLFWSAGAALERSGALGFTAASPLFDPALAGLAALALFFLFLTRIVMGERSAWWGWLVFGLAWITFVALMKLVGWLALSLLHLEAGGGEYLNLLSEALLIAGWAVFIGGSAQITLKTYRKISPYSVEAAYWLLPLLLTALGDGLLFSGNLIFGDLVRTAGALAAAAIISMPRLPELDPPARRRLERVILAGLSLFCIFIAALLMLSIDRRWAQLSPAWIALLLALLLALVINPGIGWLKKRFLEDEAGSPEALSDLLRQYSLSITNMLDLNLLATVAVGTASEYLEVRRGFLFLVEEETDPSAKGTKTLRGAKGMGELDPPPGKCTLGCALLDYFSAETSPVTHQELSGLPAFQSDPHGSLDWLSQLGAEAYAPIYSKNEWIGLLAVGPKNSGRAYTKRDLAFLSTLAGQTAVALENARLYEGLVRLNEQFRQTNRHLERLDQTKSDFLTIATHELRTPMTLISGAGQLLFDEPELQQNSYHQSLLVNLKVGIQRLDKIVESMLDMARIDTRQIQLDLQQVAIHRLIQMVHDDLRQDALQRRQTIEIKDLKRLPSVMADVPSLRKVFQNILINAIKYTSDEGKITISGQALPPNEADLPAGGVEVVVSDTGIGIDPEFRDLIFFKFYQGGEAALHSSGRNKFKGGGPGLGLSIARGIVEAHQGKIWVESPGYDEQTNPGSQFHVVLPLYPIETSRRKD